VNDDVMVYYNDQDKEVYVEIIHFYDENEEDQHMFSMTDIGGDDDDDDFLIKHQPKL
jgi:hypothetical protein